MNDHDGKLALFVMLGRTAERLIESHPDTVISESLTISDAYDLATALPRETRQATHAATVYKLFSVFENFLRDLVLGALSESYGPNWWEKVPRDVQNAVAEMEETEDTKEWMALGTRDKLALTTYPQLLKIIEECWKDGFEEIIRDKSLLQEARLITHLRNAICHMTDVPDEEVERVKQVLRDWFRIVSP